MLEKTIKLYAFEELSENVKQRAADNYRATWSYIPWLEEIRDSLKAYAEFFDFQYNIHETDWNTYKVFINLDDFENEELLNVSGVRAYLWIKEKLTDFNNDKWLTGYCADECCAMAFTDFIKKIKESKKPSHYTIADYFEMICARYTREFQNEINYFYSNDFVIDNAEANNCYFTENGKIEYL